MEVLIINLLPHDSASLKTLGIGSQFGVSLNLPVQDIPNGFSSRLFVIGESFM